MWWAVLPAQIMGIYLHYACFALLSSHFQVKPTEFLLSSNGGNVIGAFKLIRLPQPAQRILEVLAGRVRGLLEPREAQAMIVVKTQRHRHTETLSQEAGGAEFAAASC